MDVAVDGEENGVVVGDLLDDEHELVHVSAVDDGVDALVESVHRVEGGKDVADEHDAGVATEDHRHLLEGEEGGVLFREDATEGIFEENDPARRLMVIANYNNDVAEYWEWSVTGMLPIDMSNEAYKLGVNYMVYGLTH